MRLRLALTLGLLVAAVPLTPAAALAPSLIGTVTAPAAGRTGPQALLVVLPDATARATDYTSLVPAAQAASGSTRLWVAVAALGGTAADAPGRYEALVAAVKAAGFSSLTDTDVVVAAQGSSGPGALAVAAVHHVAGAVLMGSDAPLTGVSTPVLRLAGELDRGVRVSALALSATAEHPVVVLPATGRPELRGGASGGVLGDFVDAVHGSSADLDADVAGSGVVKAFAEASRLEAGDVCAQLQHHTADLSDPGLLTVTNRVDPDLVEPTPAGLTSGDLGGFLYDKSSITGTTATTNSYTVPGHTEVMCKTKSRDAVALAVYADKDHVDASPPTCAEFEQQVLDWALAQVSPSARARFAGVTVKADLSTSAGPQWVFTPLLLLPTGLGTWSVQAPSLVTQLTDTDLDPTFAGNHYCKVLSPVRALELVLEDAVKPGL